METKTTNKKIFFGWVIIGCMFLITALPMVFISNFFSYYQVPVSQELACDYVQFSTTNIFNTIGGILFGLFLAGRICSGRTRLAMVIGAVGTAAACFAQSLITQIWQYWCLGFMINVFMGCFTYTPINFIISRWFVDKKGLATSIVFAGGGVGGAIFSKPFAAMLAAHGWRYCYRFSGILALVIVLLVALIIRKDPAEKGLQALKKENAEAEAQQAASAPTLVGVTKAEALKMPSFYFYALVLVFIGMVAAGIMTHVPTYLIEAGLDYAGIMVVYSIGAIFAQLIMGTLFDKIGLVKGLLVSATLAIIGLLLLAMMNTIGSAAPYIAMVFTAMGGCLATLGPPLMTGRCFGTREFGEIYGLGNSIFLAGCMIGPMLSAAIREGTSSYVPAWFVYMAVYAGIFVFGWLAVKTSPMNKK